MKCKTRKRQIEIYKQGERNRNEVEGLGVIKCGDRKRKILSENNNPVILPSKRGESYDTVVSKRGPAGMKCVIGFVGSERIGFGALSG